MDRLQSDSQKRVGTVKDAVNMFGERINGVKADLKKTQMPFSEKPSSRVKELHLVMRDISRFDESKRSADNTKSQAESELIKAKSAVKDLSCKIEESNTKSSSQKRAMEALKKPEIHEEKWALTATEAKDDQYAQVMRELNLVKQELSKLKLDMAILLERKSQADKESEASNSRLTAYSSSIEALRKEIEDANEEQVLVELAKIEADKELSDIEEQRATEAAQFSYTLDETKKRMDEIIQEIEHSKDLENELAIVNSDVGALQNELKLIKAMNKKWEMDSTSRSEESNTALTSAKEELEAAKKELASIKEEGFQFMSSMDIIRDELKHVSKETSRLKKIEEKLDSTVQNLHSKILRAKSKLEAVSSAEEKAKSIVSNLSSTLQQLTTEAEAAKKERELISEETVSIREETQKIEAEIDASEEKLLAATQELEAIKASEATALDNLKTLSEKIMRTRASTAQHNSFITISSFEYTYLKGRAKGAEEIADKKVSAALAWIEALKASEKEIIMKTEMAHRQIRELKVVEEQEAYKTKKSLKEKTDAENELRKLVEVRQGGAPKEAADSNRNPELLRKSTKDTPTSTPMRRIKSRRPASPGAFYMSRANSVTLKKRQKPMANIGKLFTNKKDEKIKKNK
ncbi:hypothetical protein Syun_022682 [Stephania yunnanensis]|uniref:Protein PLASTID MOVEMENT IMPAIRED 2 n=1 Tax=Stephania yunnanensis TaxID=152371 RepID=A0AAP0F7G5_9MAGN